jgi:hypothetical protein
MFLSHVVDGNTWSTLMNLKPSNPASSVDFLQTQP